MVIENDGAASSSSSSSSKTQTQARNPNPPHSPLRKRILSIPSSLSPNTKLLHNLTCCHRCSLKTTTTTTTTNSSNLNLLKSQWRFVLLCVTCLSSIRSAEICSYCFAPISEDDDVFLNCLQCFHRIHYACIPNHRFYVLPSQIDAETFSCVDCCAAPKPCG